MNLYQPKVRLIAGVSCFRYHPKELKKCILSLNYHFDRVILYCHKKQTCKKIKKLLNQKHLCNLAFQTDVIHDDIVNPGKIFEYIQNVVMKENGSFSKHEVRSFYTFHTTHLLPFELFIMDLIFDYIDFWDPEYTYILLLDSTMFVESCFQGSIRYRRKLPQSVFQAYNVVLMRKDSTIAWMTYFFKMTFLAEKLLFIQGKHPEQKQAVGHVNSFSLRCQINMVNSLRDEELYYMGYSQFYAKKYKSAKYILGRRIHIQDSTEEHWHAKYLLGQIYLEEKDWEKAQNMFLQAINDRPHRGEPYYFLIREYRKNKMFFNASVFLNLFLRNASNLPINELTPIESSKYTFLLYYEITLLAIYCNDVFLGSDHCDKLRFMSGVPRSLRLSSLNHHKLYVQHFPGALLYSWSKDKDNKTFLFSNSNFNSQKFTSFFPHYHIANAHLLIVTLEKWKSFFSGTIPIPSLLSKMNKDTKLILVTCEVLNYKRDCLTGKKIFPSSQTDSQEEQEQKQLEKEKPKNKSFHLSSHQSPLRCKSETIIFLVHYDTFQIIDEYRLLDRRPTTLQISLSRHFYCGMEKVKLFIFEKNQLWVTFHSSDHHLEPYYQVGIARVIEKNPIACD